MNQLTIAIILAAIETDLDNAERNDKYNWEECPLVDQDVLDEATRFLADQGFDLDVQFGMVTCPQGQHTLFGGYDHHR